MLHDNENNLPADHQIGANNPPEPIESDEARILRRAFDAAGHRIAEEVKSANDWMAEIKVVEDEKTAKDLGTKINQITAFITLYDGMRAEEKRPYDEGAAAVQKRWLPLIETLKLCKETLHHRLEVPWLKVLQKRHDDEREANRRAAAEAQRRADQLAEQAKAHSANVVTNMAAAMDAAQEAERLRQAAADVPLRAQTRGIGRTRSLRTIWKAEIVEWDECYQHFKNHPKVRELLQGLANEGARHLAAEAARRRLPTKPSLRGCEIYSTQE
jgi:hypothetical protein